MSEKQKEIIVLRGHHLATLIILYEFGLEAEQDLKEGAKTWGYGGDFADFEIFLLKKITNGGVLVEIIDDYDDICGKCDFKKNSKCLNEPAREKDIEAIDDFGLKAGEIYDSEFIIELIKKRTS